VVDGERKTMLQIFCMPWKVLSRRYHTAKMPTWQKGNPRPDAPWFGACAC
jgi:hypothetical protein